MSKAVLCDRCKGVCSEQSATLIESKWEFVTMHIDLCPRCAEEFRKFILGKKPDEHQPAEGENDGSDNDGLANEARLV